MHGHDWSYKASQLSSLFRSSPNPATWNTAEAGCTLGSHFGYVLDMSVDFLSYLLPLNKKADIRQQEGRLVHRHRATNFKIVTWLQLPFH